MNILLRLLWTMARSLLAGRLPYLSPSTIFLRVLPNDCDPNWHLTNARYLSFCDVAMVALVIRTRFWWGALRRRWRGVIGASQILYLREIKPFSRCTITSTVLGWDAMYFYVEHRFLVKDQLHTVVWSRLALLHRGQVLPAPQAVGLLGAACPSPGLPEAVLHWRDNLQAAVDQFKGYRPDHPVLPDAAASAHPGRMALSSIEKTTRS
jgi:acyl-CoA thioesterase FadM